MNKKIPVILDCDPGVDDCIAILLALSSEKLDVRAISAVAGNVELFHTERNALDIVHYSGKDVRVAKGIDKPLFRELRTATYVHGEDGRGWAKFEKSPKTAEPNSIEVMYEEIKANAGEIEVIAVGPLTNIATLLITHPDVKSMIKRLTIMGGAVEGGNITPFAEFNIYVDPEAAKIVFESGLPITMVGLDATMKGYVTAEEVDTILEEKSTVNEQLENLLKGSLAVNEHWHEKGAVLHDALAVAYVINNDVLKTEKCYVNVETESSLTLGRTVATQFNYEGYEKNVDVALEVNRELFLEMLIDMNKAYK